MKKNRRKKDRRILVLTGQQMYAKDRRKGERRATWEKK
jgi:hypothetical protein